MPRSGSFILPLQAPGQSWGNAAGEAEIGTAARNRGVHDTRRTRTIRWCGVFSAAGGASMVGVLQGSPDASTWTDLASASIAATGAIEATAVSMPAALRIASCKFRIVARNGDGVTTAVSGWVVAEGNPSR